MNPEIGSYQSIKLLVAQIISGDWPKDSSISRNTAIVQIAALAAGLKIPFSANEIRLAGLLLDLADIKGLTQEQEALLEKINIKFAFILRRIDEEQYAQSASVVPPNLKTLVAEYERYLQRESEQRRLSLTRKSPMERAATLRRITRLLGILADNGLRGPALEHLAWEANDLIASGQETNEEEAIKKVSAQNGITLFEVSEDQAKEAFIKTKFFTQTSALEAEKISRQIVRKRRYTKFVAAGGKERIKRAIQEQEQEQEADKVRFAKGLLPYSWQEWPIEDIISFIGKEKTTTGPVLVSFGQRIKNFFGKILTSPTAPLSGSLVQLSSAEFLEEHPALALAAHGIAPSAIERAAEHYEQTDPGSKQANFWKSMRLSMEIDRSSEEVWGSILYDRFESFYQAHWQNSLPKVFETPQLKGFSKLINKGLRFFKNTKLGKSIAKIAPKILKLGGKLLGYVGGFLAIWDTIKKAGKIFLVFLGSLLMLAAHYGPLALAGAIAGGLIGLPIALKAGLATFGLFALIPGVGWVIGAIAGIIVFVVVELFFIALGMGVGVFIQWVIDQIKGSVSQANIGAAANQFSTTVSTSTADVAVPAVGGAVAVGTLGTLLAVMFIGSAFVVPEKEKGKGYIKSPYIDVVKTVSPTKLENSELPATITYTITITAKEAKIINIAVDNKTTLIRPSDSIIITKDNQGRDIANPSCGKTELEVGESCTISYAIDAKTPEFKDSLLFDLVKVTADVPEKNLLNEATTATAATIIGTPPTYCFVFSDEEDVWPPDEKAMTMQSIARVALSPTFMGGLCGDGTPITLVRKIMDPGYGAIVIGSKIIMYNAVFLSVPGNIYAIAHEGGHVFARRNGSIYQDYLDSGIYESEGPVRSYYFCPDIPPSESFAEAIGVHVTWRIRTFGGCVQGPLNFPEEYPQHYQFVKENVFGGVDF